MTTFIFGKVIFQDLQLGLALKKLNKYYEAIQCYDKAISINPNKSDAWNNKGITFKLPIFRYRFTCFLWFLSNFNQYNDAIKCYEKAISINPNHSHAWNNKGFALIGVRNYEGGIECFEKAISINPKHYNAWNNKGIDKLNILYQGSALDKLNKYSEAIVCYNQAIYINPTNHEAFVNKAFALHQLKEYQKAVECYNQALKITCSPLILQRQADSLFELGNKSNAKETYLAALQQGSPEQEYIWKQLQKL